MQTCLITGANRGIGFELTRQLLNEGMRVFAACRKPDAAQALNELAQSAQNRLSVLQMDVNDDATINAAVDALARQADALDLLINNAGIGGDESGRIMGRLAAAEIDQVIRTNAIAPLIVTQRCRDLLKKGVKPRVVMISSGMGSMQRADGSSYAYRMSKAAMNMAARVLAFDSAMAGIITVTVNPGWVQTDMGGPNAVLKPEESAAALRALCSRLRPDDAGKFFQYDGSELPW